MARRRTKHYKSDAMASIHEVAGGLHELGVLDQKTMGEFDEACLERAHGLQGSLAKINGRYGEVLQNLGES